MSFQIDSDEKFDGNTFSITIELNAKYQKSTVSFGSYPSDSRSSDIGDALDSIGQSDEGVSFIVFLEVENSSNGSETLVYEEDEIEDLTSVDQNNANGVFVIYDVSGGTPSVSYAKRSKGKLEHPQSPIGGLG